MKFIKLCRNESFYNIILLYFHIYLGFHFKNLNSFTLLQFHQRLCQYYMPYATLAVFLNAVQKVLLFLSSPLTISQQDRNALHMHRICWGLGRLEGGQEGKYLEFKFPLVLDLNPTIYFSLPEQNILRVLSIYQHASLTIGLPLWLSW